MSPSGASGRMIDGLPSVIGLDYRHHHTSPFSRHATQVCGLFWVALCCVIDQRDEEEGMLF